MVSFGEDAASLHKKPMLQKAKVKKQVSISTERD
jgi:hypothetical protein